MDTDSHSGRLRPERTRPASFRQHACLALCCLILIGCTPVKMIRTVPPTGFDPESDSAPLPAPSPNTEAFVKCSTGRAMKDENRSILENYGDYLIGYAEFDDQGWAYDHDRQIDALKRRLSAEIADAQTANTDYLVMVFIHGWHHNAHDNDCNVQEFRQMVRIASQEAEKAREQRQLVLPRRIIGIYVGWRGESVDAPGLRYTTVIDRRDVAERVAKGSVRQLLADVHDIQVKAQLVRPDKMRTVVIGHSFGGLIAFAALSQGLIDDLTLAALDQPHPCTATEAKALGQGQSKVWPDGVVLINPAFEATRFEPLHRLLTRRVPCTLDDAAKRLVVPNVIVVTAENDQWTGKVFTAARTVSTLFEAYDRSDDMATANERTANLHAVGFNPPYETHTLMLTSDTPRKTLASPLPSQTPTPNNDTPVWVVRAPKSIIDGHSGFLYARQDHSKQPIPYLADWLMQLYSKDCAAAPQMVGCQ